MGNWQASWLDESVVGCCPGMGVMHLGISSEVNRVGTATATVIWLLLMT
jgi:hypothetical protein